MLHLFSGLPLGTIVQEDLNGMPGQKMVYQRVFPGRGNILRNGAATLQLRRHVIPADPKTIDQVEQRGKMSTAVANWQALNQQQKNVYNEKAEDSGLSGYQYYVGLNMKGLT